MSIALLWAFLGTTSGAIPVSSECTGVLSVRVLDEETGEILEKVRLTLASHVLGETDSDGQLSQTQICPGRYSLTAERLDYEVRTKELHLGERTQHTLLLKPVRLTKVEDIVVEAARIYRGKSASTASLDAEALAKSRGKNLADSMAELPGVSVVRSGATAKPMIRGQSGSRILILYDGARHESQSWGADHGPELDPFTVGAIKVVKGSGSVRYGTSAIGGVLLAEPHQMLQAPGLAIHGQVIGALNGERGTVAGRLDGVPIWLEGLSLRAEGNFSKGAALSAPDYPLDNTAIEEWNLGAAARYEQGPLGLKFSFHRNQLVNGVCTCVNNETPNDFQAQIEQNTPLGYELYRADYDLERPYQWVQHDRTMARANYRLEGIGTFEGAYIFQYNQRYEYDTARRSVTGPQFDFNLQTHTGELAFEQEPLKLSPSIELQGFCGVQLRLQENIFRGLPLIPNYRDFGGSAYLLKRLFIGNVQIEAGFRYERLDRNAYLAKNAFNRHKNRGTLDEESCSVSPRSARCPSSFDIGVASLGGAVEFSEFWLARLNFSMASRIPNVNEQFINGTAPSFPVLAIGSPNLGIETSYGLSGGMAFKNDWLRAEFSGFGSYIDNYIYLAPELREDGTPHFDVLIRGTFPRFRYSGVNAIFFGAEFAAEAKWRSLLFKGQASVVRARDIENEDYLPMIPPDRFTLSSTYHLPRIWRLSESFVGLTGTYVARQSEYNEMADFAASPSDYFLLGAQIGTTLQVDNHRLMFSVEGNNLLNTRYRDYTSLYRYFADEPGYQLFLRLGFGFSG